MGDRCYFSVTVRTEDAESEEGQDILSRSSFDTDRNPAETEGPVQIWKEDQMNWGGVGFLGAWAKAGFLCYGSQDGGSDYGPSSFITAPRRILPDGSLDLNRGVDGGWVVEFSEDGDPQRDDIEAIRYFIQKRAEIRRLMEMGPLEKLAEINGEE
jgi:hypothetical protein